MIYRGGGQIGYPIKFLERPGRGLSSNTSRTISYQEVIHDIMCDFHTIISFSVNENIVTNKKKCDEKAYCGDVEP